jgi:hypothetical protein
VIDRLSVIHPGDPGHLQLHWSKTPPWEFHGQSFRSVGGSSQSVWEDSGTEDEAGGLIAGPILTLQTEAHGR